MNRRVKEDLKGTFMSSVGWLFADMLLVLTMVFLASTAFVIPKPPAKAVSRATATAKPTVTPTIAHLDKTPCDFVLTGLDYNGLLKNPPGASAIKSAMQKVKAQPCLVKRQAHQAGLVLAFGGAQAPNGALTPNVGQQIASRIDDVVLPRLGDQDHFVFFKGTVYNAYHDLGSPYGTVELVIYLFA
jgi:hypothetical protein